MYSITRLVDFVRPVTFNLVVILVVLYLFCYDCVILVLSSFFIGPSVLSWFQIYHIGTVIFFENNLALRTLWYIPIFHLVAEINIFRDDCSIISFNGITKYLDSCCDIINDQKEYKSVTVLYASVILAMHFVLGGVCDNQCYGLTIVL